MTRNAEAQAAMFAEDGVLEMPLAAEGPKKVVGHANVRAYLTEYYR
jgi:hypothetical protein